jgi:hypothetical protein
MVRFEKQVGSVRLAFRPTTDGSFRFREPDFVGFTTFVLVVGTVGGWLFVKGCVATVNWFAGRPGGFSSELPLFGILLCLWSLRMLAQLRDTYVDQKMRTVEFRHCLTGRLMDQFPFESVNAVSVIANQHRGEASYRAVFFCSKSPSPRIIANFRKPETAIATAEKFSGLTGAPLIPKSALSNTSDAW